MGQKIDKLPAGVQATALGGRQHGVITRAQLNAVGLSDRAIQGRIRAGWLHRVHRGVYTVGSSTLSRHGYFLAAVFAVGDRGVLSHRSAAFLWGLLPRSGPRIDVTVSTSGGRKVRRLVIVHRSPLEDEEVTTRHGIPVTAPARTLLDLAAVVTDRELERAFDEAAYLRLDLRGLQSRRGRPGAARLARILAEHTPGSTRTRSEFEERMIGLCRRHALPQPRVNATVEGFLVDFAWPAHRLIVETDGWKAHGTRTAFERDRRRDADLVVAGWRVVRITWSRLQEEADAVAADLQTLLAP